MSLSTSLINAASSVPISKLLNNNTQNTPAENSESISGNLLPDSKLPDIVEHIIQKQTLTDDQIESSSTRTTDRVYQAVNNFLDLSHRHGEHFFDFLRNSDDEERNAFIEMVTALIQKGIYGTEYLDLNGQPYRTFVSTKLVDPYSRLSMYRQPDIDYKV